MANFFEKLGDSVTKGLETVNQKKNDFVETNKLNSDIRAAQNQRDEDIKKLGQLVYNFKKNPGSAEPDYDSIIADMDSLDKKIEELKSQINALKNVQACPNCGSMVESGNAFCPNCGSKMPVPAAPKMEAKKTCPNCGNENGPDDKFCQNCGTKLDVANAAQTVAQTAQNVAQDVAQTAQDVTNTASEAVNTTSTQPTENNTNI